MSNIPETFTVKCAVCGEGEISDPIHRSGFCKRFVMVRHVKGRIFFQGRLINQLMKSGFSVETCYETDYPNDFTVSINHCTDSEWFRVFSINFMATKESPKLLISPKVDIIDMGD